MALTWHNQDMQELEAREGRTYYFRASEYQFDKSRQWIEAAPTATWKRFSPFSFYRPPGEVGPTRGPHIELLNLIHSLSEKRDEDDKRLEAFANKYGLLGTFHEWWAAPMLPDGKLWVAPDAKITRRGELKQLNPKKEGIELLENVLRHQMSAPADWRLNRDLVAMPSELTFAYKRNLLPGRPDASGHEHHPVPLPWEEVRGQWGARMIMDSHTSRRTAVLCTREQTASWLFELPNQQRILRRMMSDKAALASYLNTRLLGVSPYLVEGEDGQLERAWRCTTLVQAIHMMLYLDLTGGATIKTCASRGCQNYFRSNNPRRIYCSTNPCANRASTRLSRGQEP